MRELAFDYIDDADFDIDTARIVDGVFTLDGVLDFSGFERPFKMGHHVIRLRIEHAARFEFDDDAGTGQLTAESVEELPDRVVITGVIPCTLTVETMQPSRATFSVAVAPFEVRRRFRWMPSDGHGVYTPSNFGK